MKTLLVIIPGRNEIKGDCVYNLLVAETGEYLASHICSSSGFAYGDLYGDRPGRIKKWAKRFGELEVKFIDETDIDIEELVKKNPRWHISMINKARGDNNE